MKTGKHEKLKLQIWFIHRDRAPGDRTNTEFAKLFILFIFIILIKYISFERVGTFRAFS